MATDETNQVLIVGAGPSGMVMACRLAELGVRARVIDRLAQPETTSRAFTVHARTLEFLGQMGIADTFVEKGIKTYSMDYHFPGMSDTPRLDFRELDSTFPYCLTLNQEDTEAILRDAMSARGIRTEWDRELTGFEPIGEGSKVTIRHTDTGKDEVAEVRWLVACDGFYSTVREKMDIPFDGERYEGMMRMVDVPLDGFDGSLDAIHYYIAKDHMLLINKLPGKNFRVLISDKSEGVPAEQVREAFQEVVDQHFGGKVRLGEPLWATNFRNARRQANSYRLGSLFLVGDAAHVNSPAGGQGMNVAMGDAFNLGWKLAMVVGGLAHESLLDTYGTERGPVARQMLEGTNYMHNIIMAHGAKMADRIELMEADDWNKRAVSQIAGISYTYRSEDDDSQGLRVGDRAPDGMISGSRRVYDLVPPDSYVLLMVLPDKPDSDVIRRAGELESTFSRRFKAKGVVCALVGEADGPHDWMIRDEGDARSRYEVGDRGRAYLIRPDCHIAGCGELESADAFLEEQEAWLRRN